MTLVSQASVFKLQVMLRSEAVGSISVVSEKEDTAVTYSQRDLFDLMLFKSG